MAGAAGDAVSESTEQGVEREFLKSNLKNFEEQVCYVTGHFEGDLEKFLLRFMAVGSTSFTRVETHSRAKGHKRYSDAGIKAVCWPHMQAFFGLVT